MNFREINKFKETKRKARIFNTEDHSNPFNLRKNKLILFQESESEGELNDLFFDYLEFIELHPIPEPVVSKGKILIVDRMHAPCIEGFCMFGMFSIRTWFLYKERWPQLCQYIDNCIYSICFTGAAAGVLKEGIIARKLGLVDKQELEVKETQRRVVLFTQSNGRAVEIPQATDNNLIEDVSHEEITSDF